MFELATLHDSVQAFSPNNTIYTTVVPTKSDRDAIVCLQRYQGLKIDISLVY